MDPTLNQFVQPDTLIPGAGNPLSWNRYAYVGWNPINRSDPTGHMEQVERGPGCFDETCRKIAKVKADFYSLSKQVKNSTVSETLSYVAFSLDYSAFLLSGLEAGVSDGFAAGVTVVGCAGGGVVGPITVPAGCGAGALIGLSFDIEYSSWTSSLGATENLLGGGSLIVTSTADLLSGYSKIDIQKGDFKIGKDSVVSFRNFILGQIPESNVDAWISMSQVKYDTDRILGSKQNGSYEIVDNWQINPIQVMWAGYEFYFSDWWR